MLFWKTFFAEDRYATAPAGDGELEDEAMLASIQYQLTRLLESEAPLLALSARLPQVECSNMRFGADSLHTYSSQMDRAQLAMLIERWIKAFEPRLSAVSVEVSQREERRNAIHFSLLARLTTDRGSHDLAFDSRIRLGEQQVDMEGQELV